MCEDGPRRTVEGTSTTGGRASIQKEQIMTHLIRGATLAATVTLVLTGAAGASALTYPGPYIRPAWVPADLNSRPLERVGDQLVRGDDLTGAGVRASSHVPVVGPR